MVELLIGKSIMKFALSIFSFFFTMFLIVSVEAVTIEIGSRAPTLTATNQDGKSVNLGKLYNNNKYVLVYFYPKADTPGCTDQANSLKDAYETLHGKNGMAILGVSADEQDIQKDFQKKFSIPFDLIADPDKKVMKAFGVPSLMGFAKRQAFLIEAGKVVWLDRSASTKNQADDIIKYLESKSKQQPTK